MNGIQMSLHLGQRVRHQDYKGQRVTGVVRGLEIDSVGVLRADIRLDAPIVIPRFGDGREIELWTQNVDALELTPFDPRDELVAEMLAALRGIVGSLAHADDEGLIEHAPQMEAARAAIAKAEAAA